MRDLNKKHGIAEGDMHGLEDDLNIGFEDENVDDFDMEAFKKEMEEEIKKINQEYGLDENEMHGLDLDNMDLNNLNNEASTDLGIEDEVRKLGGEKTFSKDQLENLENYKKVDDMDEFSGQTGEHSLSESNTGDKQTEDDTDSDWAYDNNMVEGVDGLEEFEADLSELTGTENDDDLEDDISTWDWEDEEEESEKENERMEDGGWKNNRGY